MDIITHINGYISPLYTQKSKDIFSRLPFDKYKLLLNMYVEQHDINYNEYALFKLSNNDSVEFIDTYKTESDKNTYNVMYYDPNENTYILQIYGYENMYELIITNQNRYIFVPIMFSIKDNKIGHATMIIIDKKELTIKFFDSNGLSKGFINSNIIDRFLDLYFNIFNITFDEKYKYINQHQWITQKINRYVLNSSNLKNDNINSGHCMIFILIISHILSKEKLDLDDIIIQFNQIKKNELIDIVMGYTERAIENLKLIL